MQRSSGVGTSLGIGIGPCVLIPPRVEVRERRIALDRVGAELSRLSSAVDAADAQLSHASDQAAAAGHGEHSEFVELHRSMLRFDLAGETQRVVREQHVGAEWAVRLVVREMSRLFAEASAARISAGLDDFAAVADRLLRVLLSLPEHRLDVTATPGAIGVALELSPLDVLQLSRAGVGGLATERGGPTAHAAIVARDMGIPYVLGVPGLLVSARPGELMCVDGKRGEVVFSPDEQTLREYETRHELLRARAKAGTGDFLPLRMRDGERVFLGANADAPEGVSTAIARGAEHIGLVRTELLYLDRDTLPGEEEQYEDAVRIVKAAQGRPVTFRTLDLGGDKLPASVQLSPGSNPALGIRAVRFSLRRRDIFRSQLRALLRAASVGPTRIMFPMVSGVTELREAVRFCREVGAELASEGVESATTVPIGTMVETPSAAITADQLAASCDFLSVGTNDLIQYAFAADRQNDDVRYLYHPLHPAVLRLVQLAVAAAHRLGKPVAVCGDVAGDPSLTWVLLGLGVRDLSMAAGHLDAVRASVRGTSGADAARLAAEALAADSEVESEAVVLRAMQAGFPPEAAGESAVDWSTAGP